MRDAGFETVTEVETHVLVQGIRPMKQKEGIHG